MTLQLEISCRDLIIRPPNAFHRSSNVVR